MAYKLSIEAYLRYLIFHDSVFQEVMFYGDKSVFFTCRPIGPGAPGLPPDPSSPFGPRGPDWPGIPCSPSSP